MSIQPITGKTKVVGILGYPVEHSKSPLMQNAGFQALGLDYCYVPFSVAPEDLSRAMEAIRALNLAGANVTIPHKEAVIPFLDEVTPEAAAMGAVNTIVNRDGRLMGYNTDGRGFLLSLMEGLGLDVKGLTIVLLGAGGAARGVGMELARAGAGRLLVANRNLDRARELAGDITRHTGCLTQALPWEEAILRDAIGAAQVLINTTPIGMHPHHEVPPVVNPEYFPTGLTVCDLIYNPIKTSLLSAAEAKNLPTLSGWGMLLYQGVIAFELWTNQKAPVEIMKKALLEAL
ncbi:MAG: shikimate dehydrogenase [Clostridia bacterium]|nr:shikimate dehydrogenase [Clostridia bacterium]